jgi:UDP-galactopyranose mutase
MKKALILGGGFAGVTAANFLKTEKGFEDITIIEASSVLGGGCRTFFYRGHPYTLGPRHLLINHDEMHVWDYFSKYLNIIEHKHYLMTYVQQDEDFYTFPMHKDEIELMPDKEKIYNELANRGDVSSSTNLEEFWVNSVGETLYNKFVNSYSKKMWMIDDNKEIDVYGYTAKGVALKEGSKQCFEGQKRIGYPTELDGYNSYFDKCVEGCKVIYNTAVEEFDLDNKRVYANGQWYEGDIVINTISPDAAYGYDKGELPYMGRDFLKIILPIERMTPEPYHFIHYAGDEPYTRIFEYKILTGYKAKDTMIGVEFPSTKNKFYPFTMKKYVDLANDYLSRYPDDVHPLGRAGKYHYDNMDVIVKDCIELMKKI